MPLLFAYGINMFSHDVAHFFSLPFSDMGWLWLMVVAFPGIFLTVYMLVMHLFIFFVCSSSMRHGLDVAFDHGTPWTFHLTRVFLIYFVCVTLSFFTPSGCDLPWYSVDFSFNFVYYASRAFVCLFCLRNLSTEALILS